MSTLDLFTDQKHFEKTGKISTLKRRLKTKVKTQIRQEPAWRES